MPCDDAVRSSGGEDATGRLVAWTAEEGAAQRVGSHRGRTNKGGEAMEMREQPAMSSF